MPRGLATVYSGRRVRVMRYAVVIERAEGNFSAYVPDLPGCVGTGGTREEVEREIREAITFHLNGLREDGISVPEPRAMLAYVDTDTDPAAKTQMGAPSA